MVGQSLSQGPKLVCFLGYPSNQKGYKLLDLNNKNVLFSRDVSFHEDSFPFSMSDDNENSPHIFPIPNLNSGVFHDSDSFVPIQLPKNMFFLILAPLLLLHLQLSYPLLKFSIILISEDQTAPTKALCQIISRTIFATLYFLIL